MDVRHRAAFSTLPIFLSIGAYVFTSSVLFTWIDRDVNLINWCNAAIALGAIFMGFLSDSLCRRKMLIFIHCVAPILLTLCYLMPTVSVFYVLLCFVYNPLSTVRANLIDNTQEYSKIKLISYSFMIQFLPDSFYVFFQDIHFDIAYLSAMGAMLLSLSVGLVFFFDRRDEKIKHESMIAKIAFFAPQTRPRALLTFIAFIPTQIAYFISDNFLDADTLNPLYYSILSFGSLLGAGLSSLYKKTPHVSVLTIAYGVAFLVSVLPLGTEFLYGYRQLNVPYMFIALGTLLGFYISFVYDVILHSVAKHFRGTACGILDFVYSGASLITLISSSFLAQNLSWTLVAIAVAFAVALAVQKRAE